jgi:hypothetical protein
LAKEHRIEHMNNKGLAKIAARYDLMFRAGLDNELAYFADLPIAEAVEKAALGNTRSGKRHNHQTSIPEASLRESARRLGQNLHTLGAAERVSTLIRPLKRVGPLVVYDTALRSGARLGLEPVKGVYVQRGSLDGARALGLDASGRAVAVADLPEELQALPAKHIENLFCIYKDQLAQVARGEEPDFGSPRSCRPAKPPRGGC